MDFNKYENKLCLPVKPKRICVCCGYCFQSGDNYCSNCGYDVKTLYNDSIKNYDIERNKYNTEEIKLQKQFKKDALEDVGLLNHPHKDLIYDFAWEHGHSAGYPEVYFWLIDLYELFEV